MRSSRSSGATSADVRAFFDSSALVRLVREEEESVALRRFLADSTHHYASALVRAEVPRAARRADARAPARAHMLLDELDLIHIDEPLLADSAQVEGRDLRTLDAIHLAAAMAIRDDLDVFVTYDARLAAAAEAEGFRVESPR